MCARLKYIIDVSHQYTQLMKQLCTLNSHDMREL